jgi:hypothetical protein
MWLALGVFLTGFYPHFSLHGFLPFPSLLPSH